MGIVAAAQIYKLSPALPLIRHELALNMVQGGWLFSLINLTTMVTGIIAGGFADRFGHRRTIILSLGLMAFTAGLSSMMHSYHWLMVLRFIEGVAFMTAAVTLPTLIAHTANDRQRPLAMGLWSCYIPMGAAVALLASPILLENYGWRILWQFSALSVVLMLLAFLLFFRDNIEARTNTTSLLQNIHDILRQPAAWLLAISFGCYTITQSPLLAWLPSFLVEERGIGLPLAGAITAMIIVSNIFGGLLAGTIASKGFPYWAIICFSALLIAATSLGIFNDQLSDEFRLALLFTQSALGGLLPGTVLAAVPHFSPSPAQTATMNGIAVQGAQAGHFLGPLILASLISHISSDWNIAIWHFLTATAILFVCGILLKRQQPTNK
tara:strand:+ start:1477 stop:2619 length:1143 start_codon:yes stop_codon:yes gene_type:complete